MFDKYYFRYWHQLSFSCPNVNISPAGLLFRDASVYARTPQRDVSDGRLLPVQNTGRGPDIPGHPGALHLHHVLHGRTEPGAGTLLPGHADHHSRQQRSDLLRSVDLSICSLSIIKTLISIRGSHSFREHPKVTWGILGLFCSTPIPLPPQLWVWVGFPHTLTPCTMWDFKLIKDHKISVDSHSTEKLLL